MALEPFSTQATIGQRVTDARVLGWAREPDDETTIDTDKLNQAIQEASGRILGVLLSRYGETELESWTLTTAPAQVLHISDGLCVGILSNSAFSQNEECQEIYDEAKAYLEALRTFEMDLYGVVEGYTDVSVVEAQDDDDIDDATYFNT